MPGPGISSFGPGEDQVMCGEAACSPRGVSDLAALAEPCKQMSSSPRKVPSESSRKNKNCQLCAMSLRKSLPELQSSQELRSIPDKLSIWLCLSTGF